MVNEVQLREDNLFLENEVARLRELGRRLAKDMQREVELSGGTVKSEALSAWNEYTKGLRK